MQATEYQEKAMRTVYPSLTTDEKLSLSGLGLSGEIGEVNDLLKKFLHHKNGKALDVEKVKDELGDVLWYIALLCETLGFTIEEAMIANIAKLDKRHEKGFTPRYDSDSKASV